MSLGKLSGLSEAQEETWGWGRAVSQSWGHGWALKQAEHTRGGPRTTFSIIPPVPSDSLDDLVLFLLLDEIPCMSFNFSCQLEKKKKKDSGHFHFLQNSVISVNQNFKVP